MRIEPAMSVPTPRGEPRNARRAPSPPVEPPALSLVLWGFSVRPKMLFSESAVYVVQSVRMAYAQSGVMDLGHTIIVCGMLVLQYKMAPASRSSFTRVDSPSGSGCRKYSTYPTEAWRPSTTNES